ncbi:hypothetical protein ACFWDI_10730 [Streptomyces sp. NPDC060064]|uniref:hypothetical protein n=1 Tax=Streptomyces sp. NPDC060064 TaxID=3347049 RepID=UPI00367D155F
MALRGPDAARDGPRGPSGAGHEEGRWWLVVHNPLAGRDRGRGVGRLPADIGRLSPLKHRNLNLLGRYSFTASTPAVGALRPLRDPDAPELDDDVAE